MSRERGPREIARAFGHRAYPKLNRKKRRAIRRIFLYGLLWPDAMHYAIWGVNEVVAGEANPKETAMAERWHTQTILGGNDVPLEQRGDCIRACITSLLGLPIDAVENVQGADWWGRWQEFVGEHGFALAIVYPQAEPPKSLWIAVVPSLSLDANHSVVARGYNLVHDPGMKRRYTEDEFAALWRDGKIREGWVLVPLDPHSAVSSRALASEPRTPSRTRA